MEKGQWINSGYMDRNEIERERGKKRRRSHFEDRSMENNDDSWKREKEGTFEYYEMGPFPSL